MKKMLEDIDYCMWRFHIKHVIFIKKCICYFYQNTLFRGGEEQEFCDFFWGGAICTCIVASSFRNGSGVTFDQFNKSDSST